MHTRKPRSQGGLRGPRLSKIARYVTPAAAAGLPLGLLFGLGATALGALPAASAAPPVAGAGAAGGAPLVSAAAAGGGALAPVNAPVYPAVAPQPKLVVLIVADQFRADNLTRIGPLFVQGGLRRLVQKGAFAIGRYGQQNTYTGPGHALIATGSYGYMNGITQNKFYNRSSGRAESMLFDPQAQVLGDPPPKPGAAIDTDQDTSPRNLVGSTVFDELRMGSADSRVVSVALKARGAILLGGRLGSPYFFSDETGQMTTSSFYAKELPEWVRAWNGQKRADAAFGQKWDRLLPAASYPHPDDSPHEADQKGFGRTFPHPVGGNATAIGPAFYDAITYTPAGLELEFDFVRAALDGEKLGRRGVTDALAISVSSTDLAGHLYGPYSHEYQDMVLRFDRAVAGLLTDLDRRFKPGEVLVVFTSDHGAAPIPDEIAAQRMAAGRVKKGLIQQVVNKALGDHFGIAGEWVSALEDPSIYLSPQMLARAKADPEKAEEIAGRALLALDGVTGYLTRTQIQRGWLPPTDTAIAVTRSYFPARAGEVVVITAPFYYWGKYGENERGTSHGTFYRYDTDVPVVFMGPWFQPGDHGVIDQVDVAATIAHTLKVTPPALCAGRPAMQLLRAR